MTDIYAPPGAELEQGDNARPTELAKRSTRLFAAIIDGLIGIVFAIPFIFLAGPTLGFEFGQRTQPSTEYLVASTIYGFVIFALIHGYFLYVSGQTIGKKALGIKIVGKSYESVSGLKILGMRYLPISAISLVPVVGSFLPILDILFIFRGDRRCIHDLIAGTNVVKCQN